MPNNPKEPEVTPAFNALNKAALEHLQGKYGTDVQIKSTHAALKEALTHIDRQVPGVGGVSEYDRGFDRTSPGYDRFYDRDRSNLNIGEIISNPAENIGQPTNSDSTKKTRPGS